LFLDSSLKIRRILDWEDVTITTANSLALLSRSSLSGPPKLSKSVGGWRCPGGKSGFPAAAAWPRKRSACSKTIFSGSQRVELTGQERDTTKFLSSEPEKFSYLIFRDTRHGEAGHEPLESAVILSPEGVRTSSMRARLEAHPLNALPW